MWIYHNLRTAKCGRATKIKDKWKGQGKGHKGEGRKGKNKSRGENNWRQNSDWDQKNDWGNRPSNDWNINKPPNGNDDGGETSAQADNMETPAADKPS